MRRPLIAVLGQTATGKSALGLALAERYGGEIVSCDSTAVFRGFDIGTDKVPVPDRRGIPHHLIDIVDPTDEYSAARYGRDAAEAIRGIASRGNLPILVGGTGLYFRALTRGVFPGPGRHAELRARLERIARDRGTDRLFRMVACVDPGSARRIQPRDEKRLVRALEIYFLTGRPMTEHFAATRSPLGDTPVIGVGLRLPAAEIAARVTRRVDEQLRRGVVDEVKALLAAGVPESARPFSGLVYRQILEHLHGVRDLAATRELIIQENRRYARRQLIWFKKEPNLTWVQGAGEHPDTLIAVEQAIAPLLQ